VRPSHERRRRPGVGVGGAVTGGLRGAAW
jgi:hypothetical protein